MGLEAGVLPELGGPMMAHQTDTGSTQSLLMETEHIFPTSAPVAESSIAAT
jgi:hypothetical protein